MQMKPRIPIPWKTFAAPTAAVLLAIAFPSARAADAEAPAADIIRLDAVVVTATRVESTVMESPVSISLVDRSEIEERPTESIAELLRGLPGVMVADNTLPGMQRMRIRGEDARRSLVLIDGQEISDHSTYGPPLLIDPSFIERIEVVRGPHSTLYGSRAEGGVVNIITRRGDAAAPRGSVVVAHAGATGGYRASVAASGRRAGLDWRLGLARTRDGDRRTPSGRLPDTSTATSSLAARVGWTGRTRELVLLVDRHELESEASTPARLVDGFMISSFRMELPQRDRTRIGLLYDDREPVPVLQRFHADAFWQRVDRRLTQAIAGTELPVRNPLVRYDYFNDDFDTIDSVGVNAQGDLRPIAGHQVVAGVSWLTDAVDKAIHRTGTRTQGSTVTPVDFTASTYPRIGTLAFFVQDEWRLTESLRAGGAARQYFVRSELERSNDPALPPRVNTDERFVGNLSLVFLPGPRSMLRAVWSQGYVYPTLLHQHTGSLFGQGNLTRPNPSLRPETSENFELGARFQASRFRVDASLFTTRARNFIASVRASEVPELGWAPTESTYANLDRARTEGAELAFSGRPFEGGPEFYGAGTWLHREVTYPAFTTSENGQPEYSGRLGVRFLGRFRDAGSWRLDTYAEAGSEALNRSTRSTDRAPGWATLNVTGSLRVPGTRDWWLGFELLNALDREYRPETDELVQPGRHVNLSLRLEY